MQAAGVRWAQPAPHGLAALSASRSLTEVLLLLLLLLLACIKHFAVVGTLAAGSGCCVADKGY